MINLSALKMDNLNPGHGHLKLELCLCLMEGETMCTLTCRMDLNKLPSPEQVLTVHLLNLHTREGVSILSLLPPCKPEIRLLTPLMCFQVAHSLNTL